MFVSSLLLSAGVLLQSPQQPTLPLRRLRLYETGVGYFERDGVVGEKHDAALPLPASHLDDALKTLVVLSDGAKVEIGGIQFASSLSQGMARAIAGLPQDDTEDGGDGGGAVELAYVDLLASLEGAEIEAVSGRDRVRGRLVEVLGPFDQSAPVPAGKTNDGDTASSSPAYPREPEYTLVVRTQRGALVRMATRDLESVRPTDAAASSRMEVALAALSSRSAQSEHPLKVQIHGSGQLRLGYIAETPVWRTTYRVVLRDAGAATLQAWALIHNDTDENWRDVGIELVNGQPTSFLFPLAAPRYTRRELAEPELELATVPQLLNITPDRLYGDNIGESYGVGGLGLVGTGRGGGGTGEGTIGLGSIGTIGHGGGMGEPTLGDMARFAQATGEESGSLFTYRLANGLDLDAHHSALVPVVQETIEAEPITWFAVGETTGHSAARMLNSSGQTLPTGTISFFDDAGFVGESGLDRLKAGEQAYVLYGADLDLDLERRHEAVGDELSAARFADGALQETRVVETLQTFELRNRGGQARTAYVVLDVQRNASVTGHDAIDFDHDRGLSLARFEVAAGSSTEKTLRIKRTDHRSTKIEALGVGTLRELADATVLSARQRKAASQAADTLGDIASVRELADAGKTRIEELGHEIERLREDLRALGETGLKDRSAKNLARRMVERENMIAQLQASQKRHASRLVDLDGQLRAQLSGI